MLIDPQSNYENIAFIVLTHCFITALIDPITGKLPKNYKQILSETKGNLPKTCKIFRLSLYIDE